MSDKRPDPKPRKHPQLWQAYLWLDELETNKVRHELRISSIEKGKSNQDPQMERDILEHMQYDTLIKKAKKVMINWGRVVGPIWDWLIEIRGLAAGKMAAQLLAQIDDIAKFDTISKLWRFAGWAVIDGAIERGKKGESRHYNRRLKSICYLIAHQFVLQQTPQYVDLYYEFYNEDRQKHPNTICKRCSAIFPPGSKCPECGQSNKNYGLMYSPAHIKMRARRKLAKVFLSHVWMKWREFEDLPVSDPYVQTILGHTNIVEPV